MVEEDDNDNINNNKKDSLCLCWIQNPPGLDYTSACYFLAFGVSSSSSSYIWRDVHCYGGYVGKGGADESGEKEKDRCVSDKSQKKKKIRII